LRKKQAEREFNRGYKDRVEQMAKEEEKRNEKIKKQVQLKLDSIQEFVKKIKRKRKDVMEFQKRTNSEETRRLSEQMS
jgi:hypothetical protein